MNFCFRPEHGPSDKVCLVPEAALPALHVPVDCASRRLRNLRPSRDHPAMSTDSIKIAVAQSLITPDVCANGSHIRDLMTQAAAEGARLVQFTEGALSGYSKAQIRDWHEVDWDALRQELEQVAAHAERLGIWVALGCNHQLPPPNRPHNSVHVISDEGKFIGRYNKRFCSHSEVTDWYTPGSTPFMFEVDGFRFGSVLCIEVQFPELFAEYEGLGVDCLLFSAYSKDPMYGIQAQAHAATNCYWIGLATPAQCSKALPSAVIGPDGYVSSQAPATGEAAVVCSVLNRQDQRYEIALTKARPWRALARRGDIYRTRLPTNTGLTDGHPL
jgi:predicted amidohydrolase